MLFLTLMRSFIDNLRYWQSFSLSPIAVIFHSFMVRMLLAFLLSDAKVKRMRNLVAEVMDRAEEKLEQPLILRFHVIP